MGNIRRSRGYNFEKMLVEQFNQGKWKAKRLGGTTIEMPDILTVNNEDSILYTIEAKTTSSNHAYVPNDELVRCFEMLDMFPHYKKRAVLLAFKFRAKKKERKLQYYLIELDQVQGLQNIKSITCNYEGKIKHNQYEKNVMSGFVFHKYQMASMI